MAQDISCSACGATLPAQSQHIAVAVCPTCDNTLLVKEDQVQNIGVKATLAEPDSCLSVGWRAKVLGRELTTHGRVQYKYDGGFWDEYWIHFDGDDGSKEYWISLDEGEYMLEEAVDPGFVPAFRDLQPGDKLVLQGEEFVIEEKRTAEMVGFQGYLPFYVPPDRSIEYLDLNSGSEKATITYYPDGSVKAFKGRYLAPTELEPIFPPGFNETEPGLGGKPKRRSLQGKQSREARQVSCPNCGGEINLNDGTKTVMVMCGYCDSALDVSEGACKLLATYKRRKIPSVLPLGKVGKLGGKDFVVIGRIRYRENDDGDIYTSDEYQLRADDGEYLFLSLEEGSWSVSTTQRIEKDFPNPKELKEGQRFQAFGHSYKVTDRWQMSVSYVEGELTWIAKRGDTIQYMDSKSAKNGTLTAEWSDSEMEWYRGKSVPTKFIEKAFGIKSPPKTRSHYEEPDDAEDLVVKIVNVFAILFVIFIACVIYANDGQIRNTGGSRSSGGSYRGGGGFSSGK